MNQEINSSDKMMHGMSDMCNNSQCRAQYRKSSKGDNTEVAVLK